MKLGNFKIPVAIILFTLGIILGVEIQKAFSVDNLQEGVLKLKDVLTYTDKYYVEKVDNTKLVNDAINGMLNDLDPHSVYIPPKEQENVQETLRGDFDGIGIEYQMINDTITVVSAIAGGPSEALGIKPRDQIIEIEGKSAIGFTNDQVRNSLRGKAGTKVSVTIKRYGVKSPIHYDITRNKIPLYSVVAHFLYDSKTGYVKVSRFSETTFDELSNALKDLKAKGMQQLILDLRGNPGGYLEQAVKMSDLFISGKKKIVYTKGRKSNFDEEYYSSETSAYENVPLIILVNSGSASASEIVSGAVQDWDRGLIVGETTFGKGLVQRSFVLPDNSVLRLTVSKYYTPSGRSIQRDYKDLKNIDEYYEEAGDQKAKEGNNLEHTAEKDSTKAVYKTHSGRIVYGGGGITPDYIIKSGKLTAFTTELLKNNLFYPFMLHYLDTHSNRIKTEYGNDLNKFLSDFSLSSKDLDQFINFVKSKGVKFIPDEYARDQDYIISRLKAQVARNFWGEEGWFSEMLTSDTQFQKAVTLFHEAKELANLK
jgi:carboxyl-terminal processing protease